MIEKREITFKDQEEFRKAEIKRLTSEEFFNEYDSLKEKLLQLKDYFELIRQENKEKEELKNKLIKAVKEGSAKVSDKELYPEDIVKELKKVEGSKIKGIDRGRVEHWIEEINKFAQEYNLDLQVTSDMDPDQILREIEKAHHARLWELENRIEK